MAQLGMIEIFYGQPWNHETRLGFARFLREIHFDFYLYGPKADDAFRKNWQRPLTLDELDRFQNLRQSFRNEGILFGVILSPHGLNKGMTPTHRAALAAKIQQLNELNLDFFGLFFDDMASAPDLARRQLEVASIVKSLTKARLIFCPSFYSHDSMLDMLFGQRPASYLEELGRNLPQDVEILWTGEQIISPEISPSHLQEVTALLKRKPFVCDNFFADDGPINCNFLRLLPPTGRDNSLVQASHWGLNPMNQPALSKIALLAFSNFARNKMSPKQAFESAVESLTEKGTADFILSMANDFSTKGLEVLPEGERQKIRDELRVISNPFHQEIIDWLAGLYSIDFIKMIEQSCYTGEDAN
jgi:hypothetical protein